MECHDSRRMERCLFLSKFFSVEHLHFRIDRGLDVILSNFGDARGTRRGKNEGETRGWWYVGGLVAGYDVPGVHWEFVLTCSRCQFSSNRIDYIPRLSISFPPSSRIARAHRFLVFVQPNSPLLSAAISLIVKNRPAGYGQPRGRRLSTVLSLSFLP